MMSLSLSWGGHWLVQMEWRPARWLMASVNLPLHHKVQKFSSGTGSPGWSQKKGRKTVVCVCVSLSWHWWVSCDSVCCMCGEAWSSRWLMTQLTNGQHACMLMFVQVVDILNMPCNCQFVFSVLDELLFHTTLDAVGNILRVHYKSMKYDVSFSQGRVNTLFRWGEHVFSCMCKNVLPAYSSAKIIKNKRFFPELWSQMYCHVF